MNTKTTWRFRIKTNEYQSMIEGDRSNLFRNAKRGGNTGILLVEPDRKKTLNWSKKKCLLQNALFTVRLLWHESARVETGNFHTFSLVEKAHVTIKRKIRMCWTHGLPWELLETKWLTNTEDCSYLPLATSDSASPKPKMNWKLIKTLERGWYQVLLTPAYD